MYSIGLKLSRSTILFLTIALACGFASLVYWRWLVATPRAERGQTLNTTTASISRAKSQPITEVRRSETGRASWYSVASKTANGEQMDSDEMTAAHPSLPFGTQVQVENLDNGRTVTVRVNDRGPFVGERIIDVSKAAAKELGMMVDGVATVRISPQSETK